jgi:prepilin-type N-terminal cleavage/methylation domain-containing protein
MIKQSHNAFTIVELLIVIVIIGILATVTIVAFNGVSQRAKVSGLSADLANASKQLKLFKVEGEFYPTALNCNSPGATEICIKVGSGTYLDYRPSPAVNPTSFRLIANNGSTSYEITDSSSSATSYAGSSASITNLISNGDFSSGSTSWNINCAAPGTCSTAGGYLTMNAVATQYVAAATNAPGTYTDNDKIYYSARIKKVSGSGMVTRAHRDTGGFATNIMTNTAFNNAPTGTYVRQSGLRTFLSSQGTFTSFIINEYTAGPVFQAEIDDVLAINLTRAFGAGNEPTAAQMDSILSRYPNGWFSGTIQITY